MNKSVDIAKAFTHIFDDPQWVGKSAVGALVSLVFVLNFAVYGYEVRVIRQVSRGQRGPLPNWGDFGNMFGEGLALGLARLLVLLPIVFFVTAPVFGLLIGLPVIAAFVAQAAEQNAERIVNGLAGVGLLGAGLMCGLGLSLSLAFAFVSPAMTAAYASQGTFSACFDVKEISRFIRQNTRNYVMACLAGIGALFVINIATLFLSSIPCIGWLLALPLGGLGVFYVLMVIGHAVGQVMALDDARHRVVVAATAA